MNGRLVEMWRCRTVGCFGMIPNRVSWIWLLTWAVSLADLQRIHAATAEPPILVGPAKVSDTKTPPPIEPPPLAAPNTLGISPPPQPPLAPMPLSGAEKDLKSPGLREKKTTRLKDIQSLADRERKRAEIRQRLQHRLEVLRKKQKESGLTAEEEKHLKRLEEVSRNFGNAKRAKPGLSAAGSDEK